MRWYLGTSAAHLIEVALPLALMRLAAFRMSHAVPPNLKGRSILIVEDEPLIALDIALAFEKSGATVTTTGKLLDALVLVQHDGLSAAVLDHALGDGDSDTLCNRLNERGIPFVNYT